MLLLTEWLISGNAYHLVFVLLQCQSWMGSVEVRVAAEEHAHRAQHADLLRTRRPRYIQSFARRQDHGLVRVHPAARMGGGAAGITKEALAFHTQLRS